MNITFFDFILLPVFMMFFYILVISYKKRHFGNSLTGKLFIYGFHVKMLGTIAFIFLTEYYLKGGDSAMYYSEGVTMNKLFFSDFSNLQYFFRSAEAYHDFKFALGDLAYGDYLLSEANVMPMRWVAFFSFFTFRNYSVTCIFFSVFSFLGQWQLFKSFLYFSPKLQKQLAIACLFIPSLAFWGSGILKDTICLGCTGFAMKATVNIFFRKQKIFMNVLGLLICLIMLYIIKIYIVLVLLPCILIWLFIQFKRKISRRVQFFFIYPLALIFLFAVINFFKNIDQFSIKWFTEKVETQRETFASIAANDEGSFFNLGDLDPTPAGLLKKIPAAINATLFRPYLWESRKIVMLFSAIESAVILIFSIYVLLKTGIFNIIRAMQKKPVIFMCFIFSVIFAFAIGMTTPNFGTLVRYKIQCIPFYVGMLFMLLDYKRSLPKKQEFHFAQ